jgi:hypothetical protein
MKTYRAMGFTPYCFADDSATGNFSPHSFFQSRRGMPNKKPAGKPAGS